MNLRYPVIILALLLGAAVFAAPAYAQEPTGEELDALLDTFCGDPSPGGVINQPTQQQVRAGIASCSDYGLALRDALFAHFGETWVVSEVFDSFTERRNAFIACLEEVERLFEATFDVPIDGIRETLERVVSQNHGSPFYCDGSGLDPDSNWPGPCAMWFTVEGAQPVSEDCDLEAYAQWVYWAYNPVPATTIGDPVKCSVQHLCSMSGDTNPLNAPCEDAVFSYEAGGWDCPEASVGGATIGRHGADVCAALSGLRRAPGRRQ